MATLFLDTQCEPDYGLMGISCHDHDYRFVWKLNLATGWYFERTADFHAASDQGGHLHARFICIAPGGMQLTLLANHAQDHVLMPEWNRLDFILKLEDAPEFFLPELTREIRRIPGVLAVLVPDMQKLKLRTFL